MVLDDDLEVGLPATIVEERRDGKVIHSPATIVHISRFSTGWVWMLRVRDERGDRDDGLVMGRKDEVVFMRSGDKWVAMEIGGGATTLMIGHREDYVVEKMG